MDQSEARPVGQLAGMFHALGRLIIRRRCLQHRRMVFDRTGQNLRSLKRSVVERMCRRRSNGQSTFLPSKALFLVAERAIFSVVPVSTEQSHTAQKPDCPSSPQSLDNRRVDATKKDNH